MKTLILASLMTFTGLNFARASITAPACGDLFAPIIQLTPMQIAHDFYKLEMPGKKIDVIHSIEISGLGEVTVRGVKFIATRMPVDHEDPFQAGTTSHRKLKFSIQDFYRLALKQKLESLKANLELLQTPDHPLLIIEDQLDFNTQAMKSFLSRVEHLVRSSPKLKTSAVYARKISVFSGDRATIEVLTGEGEDVKRLDLETRASRLQKLGDAKFAQLIARASEGQFIGILDLRENEAIGLSRPLPEFKPY